MHNPELNKYLKFLSFFVIGSILFFLGFLSGKLEFTSQGVSVNNSNQYLYGDFSGSQVGINVDLLWEAWKELDNKYIDSNLDKQKMLYGSINGLVDSLGNPFNQFLTPDETGEYLQNSGGKFEGIGAFLRFNGEYTVIDTPINNYPAHIAGLMPGDVILEVDGKDVSNTKAYEVSKLIRGPKGTDVHLKIFRAKDSKELEFTIKRESIDIDNVKLEEIKNKTALIKIYKFSESDQNEFITLWNSTVNKILEENVDNLIIDLRNNPGGQVALVQYVTEEFLEKGKLIMIEEDRNGNRNQYISSRDGKLKDKKIILLINEGSASASEIITGALKDHNRAVIIGKPTLGKGFEQTVVTLSDGSTMHIVFRKWLTPNGNQVSHDQPIKPDIDVDLTTEDFENGKDPQLDKAWEVSRS